MGLFQRSRVAEFEKIQESEDIWESKDEARVKGIVFTHPDMTYEVDQALQTSYVFYHVGDYFQQ